MGVEREPDYIIADSGSCDIGPQALGGGRGGQSSGRGKNPIWS